MIFSSYLRPDDRLFVLDASVMINLAASGAAEVIIAALPGRSVVADQVFDEIDSGNHDEAIVLRRLVTAGNVERVRLERSALEMFGTMVAGSTAATLGDGEAATIALAVSMAGVAIIDEKKGWKIARERYGDLRLATSVDVLAVPDVGVRLGDEALAGAVLAALREARMQVREHQLEWVVSVIGEQQASSCSSLARLMRRRPHRAA